MLHKAQSYGFIKRDVPLDKIGRPVTRLERRIGLSLFMYSQQYHMSDCQKTAGFVNSVKLDVINPPRRKYEMYTSEYIAEKFCE
jgi:hypothetical protein